MPKVMAKLPMFADPVEIDEGEIPGLRGQGLTVKVVQPEAPKGDPDPGSTAGGTTSTPDASGSARVAKPRTDSTKGDPS